MGVGYSEALEQQLVVLRFVSSPQGKRYCHEVGGAAWDWASITKETLTAADPFWVSREIGGVLEQSSRGMPPWTLTEDVLPARSGFAWFEQPFDLTPIRLHPGDRYGTSIANTVQGIAWSRRQLRKPDGSGEIPALMLVYFGHVEGIARTVPVAFWWWRVGESHLAAARSLQDGDDGTRNPYRIRRLEYLAALLAFVEQRFLVAPAERPDRATRRRAAHEGWVHEPLVRVVQLRRRAPASAAEGEAELHEDGAGAGAEAPADWSCRWVVRGHWRLQACGTGRAERRPRWILPHVKGPPGKPLKAPGATIFAVVR